MLLPTGCWSDARCKESESEAHAVVCFTRMAALPVGLSRLPKREEVPPIRRDEC